MTTTKECGCSETTVTRGYIIFTTGQLCEAHKLQQQISRANEEKANIEQSTELNCDKCGQLMGWVNDFDLNGSSFYCNQCKLINNL